MQELSSDYKPSMAQVARMQCHRLDLGVRIGGAVNLHIIQKWTRMITASMVMV